MTLGAPPVMMQGRPEHWRRLDHYYLEDEVKRLIIATGLALATLGAIHPHAATATGKSISLLNFGLLSRGGIHSNVTVSPPPVADVIQSDVVYCTDGTTTCGELTSPNISAARTLELVAGWYGTDSTRGYPFSLGGNTPDYVGAGCAQAYRASNGDVHQLLVSAVPGPPSNDGFSDPGTITGKAVLLPNDTESNAYYAYSGMNIAGTDTTLGTTINYAKGNQYTDNVDDVTQGGSGFELSLTGPEMDRDLTTNTSTTLPGQATLTCSTEHATIAAGQDDSEAVTDPDGDEYPG